MLAPSPPLLIHGSQLLPGESQVVQLFHVHLSRVLRVEPLLAHVANEALVADVLRVDVSQDQGPVVARVLARVAHETLTRDPHDQPLRI